MSDRASTIGWIIASIGSSVGLILLNKRLMSEYHFNYVFTLTSFHFSINAVGMEVLALLGFFTRQRMPFKDLFIMAVMCIGSVAFMNFSLQMNSVGFYQVCKLMCIPAMVFLQSRFYGQQFGGKIIAILFVIIAGVGIATVTDMQLNMMGSIAGAIAVIVTAQFQIMQGDKQRQHALNAMQINHSQALPSALLCGSVAFILEMHGGDPDTNIKLHQFEEGEVGWIFASCVLAFGVNLATYGLIGKTSPVTYQVVGHAKTCLVLVGGYILFPIVQSNAQLLKNLAGVVIAMGGVIVYTELKLAEGATPKYQDWCDLYLPSFVLKFLLPALSTTSSTAAAGGNTPAKPILPADKQPLLSEDNDNEEEDSVEMSKK